MAKTVEAVIEADGSIHLLESVTVGTRRRALVTVLDEEPYPAANECASLSEAALSDWSEPEEDLAWSHLQPAR